MGTQHKVSLRPRLGTQHPPNPAPCPDARAAGAGQPRFSPQNSGGVRTPRGSSHPHTERRRCCCLRGGAARPALRARKTKAMRWKQPRRLHGSGLPETSHGPFSPLYLQEQYRTSHLAVSKASGSDIHDGGGHIAKP